MKPGRFNDALREALADQLPEGVQVSCGTGTEELAAPYVVVSVAADQELVARNHTWEMTVSASLHANAYDSDEETQHDLFQALCDALDSPKLVRRLNKARDFQLYCLRLHSVDEGQAEDGSYSRTATARAVVQF